MSKWLSLPPKYLLTVMRSIYSPRAHHYPSVCCRFYNILLSSVPASCLFPSNSLSMKQPAWSIICHLTHNVNIINLLRRANIYFFMINPSLSECDWFKKGMLFIFYSVISHLLSLFLSFKFYFISLFKNWFSSSRGWSLEGGSFLSKAVGLYTKIQSQRVLIKYKQT